MSTTRQFFNNYLYEMGWNDVIIQLRITITTHKEKKIWAYASDSFCKQIINGQIQFDHHEEEYTKGATDAAKAFLNNEPTPLKGEASVLRSINSRFPGI